MFYERYPPGKLPFSSFASAARLVPWHPMLRKAAASAVTAAALAAGSASAACDDVKKAEADFKKAAKKPDPKSMAELQLGLATKQRRVFVTSGIDDESAKA